MLFALLRVYCRVIDVEVIHTSEMDSQPPVSLFRLYA